MIGIPLGSIIGTYSGWRMTFVMVAVLGVVALLGIRALLPDVESPRSWASGTTWTPWKGLRSS